MSIWQVFVLLIPLIIIGFVIASVLYKWWQRLSIYFLSQTIRIALSILKRLNQRPLEVIVWGETALAAYKFLETGATIRQLDAVFQPLLGQFKEALDANPDYTDDQRQEQLEEFIERWYYFADSVDPPPDDNDDSDGDGDDHDNNDGIGRPLPILRPL